MLWARLVQRRQTWAFALGKFMTDPIRWLFQFWLPDFLYKHHKMSLRTVGPPLFVIYGWAMVGSIDGGWLFVCSSSSVVGRRMRVSEDCHGNLRARGGAHVVCLEGIESVACGGLDRPGGRRPQGWSANMFTFRHGMFPNSAVGSVVGLGGMVGTVGGLLFAKMTGNILQWTESYRAVFIVAGSTYLAALVIIHMLVPNMEPAQFELETG